jgi:D-3-phosphoglycerate dehydrogenase
MNFMGMATPVVELLRKSKNSSLIFKKHFITGINKGILIFEPKNYSPVAIKSYSSIGPVWCSGIDQFDPQNVECLVIRLANFIDEEFLGTYPNLKTLVSPTTGTTHIDLQICESKGIRVFTLRDCMPKLEEVTSTAEHALCLLLSIVRHLPQANSSTVERGEWNRDQFCSRQLSSLRLGIVGLGRIGKWMARYAKTIGMKVAAYDPYIPPEAFQSEGVSSLSLDELCCRSDILSIHADLRTNNLSLIDSDLLDLLPEGAYLINTSRGELLDEEAVAKRVRNSRLAGVAVDVLRGEHVSGCLSSSPLMKAARDGFNILITPHIGGCTTDAMQQTEEFLAELVTEELTS